MLKDGRYKIKEEELRLATSFSWKRLRATVICIFSPKGAVLRLIAQKNIIVDIGDKFMKHTSFIGCEKMNNDEGIKKRTRKWKEGIYEYEAEYCALASRVMTIAVANITVGYWAAYIDAVPGENHDEEFDQLLEERRSVKLSYEIAKIIYPCYDGKYVWRK